jgi:hypothetical protein
MTQANLPMLSACPPRTSGLAIASMVLGITAALSPPFSCLCCCVPGVVLAALAIVFGHTARGQIRRAQGMLSGAGMALAGLICGYVAVAIHLVVLALYLVFCLISVAAEHHQSHVYRM